MFLKIVAIGLLTSVSSLYAVEANPKEMVPFTDQEKQLMQEIKELHGQIQVKRDALIVLLKVSHPKLAERMQNRIENRENKIEHQKEKRAEKREQRHHRKGEKE